MPLIVIHFSPSELDQLDAVVRAGGFSGREEAVHAGIGMLVAHAHDARVATDYARAYAETPLTVDETQVLDAATELSAAERDCSIEPRPFSLPSSHMGKPSVDLDDKEALGRILDDEYLRRFSQ
jgi:hypothetical protein